jgi:hypothetical protein
MSWTINGRTLAALGITSARLTRGSFAEHALELVWEGRDATLPPVFADGADVVLSDGATTRFVGEILEPGRAMSGPAESHTARAVNAWIALEETTYEQAWAILAGSGSANKARCIVGLKADGTVGTLAEAIEHVLSFAGVAAGSIALAVTEEPWEVRNVTCAEVLRQIQRLVPRSVSWWTYPGNVPTFNVASAPTTLTLAAGGDTDIVLRPNRRQAVRGVRLQYEVQRTTDDVAQTDVVVDSAGATTGRRVLMQTIPWRGSQSTFARMRTKVQTVPVNVSGALALVRRWWGAHAPGLRIAKAEPADLTVPQLNFALFDVAAAAWPAGLPPGFAGYGTAVGGKYYFGVKLANVTATDGTGPYELRDPDDETSEKIRLDTGLLRELLDGAVTPWMERLGKKAQRWTICANVNFIEEATRQPKQEIVMANFTATDCVNKEYAQMTNYADGDPVPSGLAAALFAALGETYHEGTVAKIEAECSGFAREGQKLQITGGATEWATMNALVQGVQEDIVSGLTTLTVGVGPNLAPGDMLDLLRRERRRAEADSTNGVSLAASKGDGKP